MTKKKAQSRASGPIEKTTESSEKSISSMPTCKPSRCHLIIVSLLRGDGPTGVETHFNEVLKAAANHGIASHLVTPYSSTPWLQLLWNFIANRLQPVNAEWAYLVLRYVYKRRIRRHLERAIKEAHDKSVTLSAQDPLSAEIALEFRKKSGCRVVAVCHFNISEADEFVDRGDAKRNGSLWNALAKTEAQSLPAVDVLIFVSEFMKQQTMERIDALKFTDIRVIPNFTSARNQNIVTVAADQKKHAISIGTLEPRKNQQFLLHVIAACKRKGHLYSLDIVGSGIDHDMLQALSNKLGISRQIRFLGFIQNAAELIPDYKVLLHAAKMESFGIVLIEAMSRSIPVIACAVGGVPEVFSDGVEGLYWNTSSVEASAEQMISLLEDENRYAAMTLAANKRFNEHFDSSIVARRWLSATTGLPFLDKK